MSEERPTGIEDNSFQFGLFRVKLSKEVGFVGSKYRTFFQFFSAFLPGAFFANSSRTDFPVWPPDKEKEPKLSFLGGVAKVMLYVLRCYIGMVE